MKQFNTIKWFYIIIPLLLLSIVGAGCAPQQSQPTEEPIVVATSQSTPIIGNEPIQPIPLHITLNENKVALGGQLFHDPQLSRDNTVACSSCHNLDLGGMDRLVYSVDHLLYPVYFVSLFRVLGVYSQDLYSILVFV